jgi:CRISPR-associated endoribonuclease Cas6
MSLPFQASTLTTTHLTFTVEIVTPLELNEYSGSALRGSFFNAIWQRFCTNKSSPTCAVCPLHDACPVGSLVAPLREENPGGRDIPRPYVIIPPLVEGGYYPVGQRISFGMILIGNIVQLLPYILLSIPQLEVEGLGHRLDENQWQRGRFRVEQVECTHPFSGQRQTIYEAGALRIKAPTITVQPQEYTVRAAQLNKERMTLQFITPLRLVYQEQPLRQASFSPLVQRLLERYLALEQYYGNQELTLSRGEKNAWLHLADTIRCTKDETRWQELKSYSNRQKQSTSIGGLIGTATFEGDLTPFLDMLIIGELIHVGKNVVKGSGWYKIVDVAENV